MRLRTVINHHCLLLYITDMKKINRQTVACNILLSLILLYEVRLRIPDLKFENFPYVPRYLQIRKTPVNYHLYSCIVHLNNSSRKDPGSALCEWRTRPRIVNLISLKVTQLYTRWMTNVCHHLFSLKVFFKNIEHIYQSGRYFEGIIENFLFGVRHTDNIKIRSTTCCLTCFIQIEDVLYTLIWLQITLFNYPIEIMVPDGCGRSTGISSWALDSASDVSWGPCLPYS